MFKKIKKPNEIQLTINLGFIKLVLTWKTP